MTAPPARARAWSGDRAVEMHVLHPGDVACGGRGDGFETLLGSCVAILLADPRRTFGAMCHIVHSGTPPRHAPASCAYGQTALSTLYTLLRENGLNPMLCEAWIFGGGNMFPTLVQQRHVGDDNVRWAFDALRADGLRIVADDVGGEASRRVRWTVGAGDPVVQTTAM